MTEGVGAGEAGRRGWTDWLFVAVMLALMALFAVLGLWQVDRLGEKERLIASVTTRIDQPATDLPPQEDWSRIVGAEWEYRPVRVTGTYRPEATIRVFTSLGDARGTYSGPGYWIVTPLDLAAGGTVMVNRGFVPQPSATAFASGGPVETGLVTLEGLARSSEPVTGFTPALDAAQRIDWVRNTDRLASVAGLPDRPVAPIYLDLPAGPAGALPQGGETMLSFPNNHLGYAMTWFGFAALVPFLLFFWLRRPRAKPPAPGA